MPKKPSLVVLSHVFPFPGNAGQQQRVSYTLKALRENFRVTFAGFCPSAETKDIETKLAPHCDHAFLFPSLYAQSFPRKLWSQFRGQIRMLQTGLKFSNYLIGDLEFNPRRIARWLASASFDCALFEYWHAANAVPAFRRRGIPCILDMHNILWQSYQRQLQAKTGLARRWAQLRVASYKNREEQAWRAFDALIAINRAEESYVSSALRNPSPASNPASRSSSSSIPIFYAPMGVSLDLWPFSPAPADPPRIAYYGGLASPHNQADALRCFHSILPHIWKSHPQTEFWIVGSNPPDSILALQNHAKVRVTGFVENVQTVLQTMTASLCPWSGTYGFRSRIVEIMALGIPVAASPDAVYGMGLQPGQGLFLEHSDQNLAQACQRLITDPPFASAQRQLARSQIENQFSFDATYRRLSLEIESFLRRRSSSRGQALNPRPQTLCVD